MTKKLLFLSLISFAPAGLPAMSHAQSAPEAVVSAFYKYDRAHSSDIVNERTVVARRRWLSADLYRRFMRHLQNEKKILVGDRATDKPLFGDGFPFQPYSEPCEMTNGKRGTDYLYNVGRSSVRQNTASVPVKFFYPKQCKPHEIKYTFVLVKSRNRWMIDDVRYESGSSLRDSLKIEN